jgi:hypothetical protein
VVLAGYAVDLKPSLAPFGAERASGHAGMRETKLGSFVEWQ